MNAPESPVALTGTVVRGIGFAGSGFVLARGITLAAYIVLARLITPAELGYFAAGSILVGIAGLFAESGMAAAVIHRRDRLDEAAATATVATVAAGIVIGLVALATAPLIGHIFDSSTVAAVATAMAGVLFLFTARVVPNALLQRRFSFLRRLVVQPAAALVFGAAAIISTSQGSGVWGLVIGLYASAVVDFVLSWALVQWRPRLSLVSFRMWRELVAYGRHVLAGTAVRRIGDQVPVVAAGSFIGAATLGQFQYANRIVSTPFALLVAGVSYVVFPAFARISHDERRFEPAFLRSLRWMTLAAMPIGLILIPLGEPLTVLVFGETWAEAGEATVALCLFIPARAIAQVIGEGFKAAGHPAERTRANVVGVVAGALAMAALIPPFGLIGVALGVSVDAIASAVLSLRRAHRGMSIPMSAMLASIAPPSAAALVMAAVMIPVQTLLVDGANHGTALGLTLLAGEGVLGFAIYAAVLRIAAPGVASEFAALLRTARRGPGRRQPRPLDA